MSPTDFDSFAYGFNLNSASYSGGAGGSFANLIAGREDWSLDSGTPTFETKAGVEGVVFSGIATESIFGEHRALWECTIIATVEAPSTGSQIIYPYGGIDSASNTFGIQTRNFTAQAFKPSASSGFTAQGNPTTTPHVIAVSYSPVNGTTYAQMDDSAPVSNTQTAGNFSNAATITPSAAIGRHRTTYFTGWVGRVLVFDRALHFRDNTNLQLLMANEMALVGL